MIRAILSLAILFNVVSASAGDIDGKISHFGETMHLELKGQEHWIYKIEKSSQKGKTEYVIQVPRLNKASISSLEKVQIPGLEKAKVEEGVDQGHQLRLTFKGEAVDHFDYLTDRPSRLIVDFFPEQTPEKPGPAKAKANTISSRAQDRSPAGDILVINPQGPLEGSATESALTSQTGIFDGADPDFSRFMIQDFEVKDEAIIASRQKVYVDFPILHDAPDELELLETKPPVYEIETKEGDENKQARLLQTLFQNKRSNVFLKTADWFSKKYPDSEYKEILGFMTGDVYFDLWRQDKKVADLDEAVKKYEEVLKEFPKSALRERTLLVMAYAQLERGDALGALQSFKRSLSEFPKSNNTDLIKIAMAEAYVSLSQFNEALQTYDDVIQNGKRPQEKIRAAYLRPDVLFRQQKDAEAIVSYESVLKKYPKEAAEYPNARFNLAAARFRMGDFRKSLEDHLDFVKNYPTHAYSGYAMTRVGELLEILGADPARTIGAYLETYFRYGQGKGAVVARLRLLSARMKSMKGQELETAVAGIMDLASKSDLPKMDQFATLMVADGFHARGDYDRSSKLLVDYYQKNPTSADTHMLTQRIIRNIADQIHDQVELRDFVAAMKTHQKYAGNWLEKSNRVDVKYDLGRAFEQAGVYKESEKLYRDVLNRTLALKGTSAEKETGVFEKLPSGDELQLRLASVNLNLDQPQQAYENLRSIEKPAALSDKDQVERIVLSSKIYEMKGEAKTAVRYLTEILKTWKGIPALVSEPYYKLGQLEEKLGAKADAVKSYQRVDELMRDSGKVNEGTHLRALENMARLQLEIGQQADAVKTYTQLLDLYEAKKPVSSLRYKLGKVFFDRGEVQKASEVWGKLDADKGAFWTKLAKENLSSSKWSDENKKYLNRLPASKEVP